MAGKKKTFCRIDLGRGDAKRVMTVLEALGIKCKNLSFEDNTTWSIRVEGVSPKEMSIFLRNFRFEPKGGEEPSDE